MRALSITQPWATLIIRGVKEVETRSWTTDIRGRIAIHASKNFPPDARDFAMEQVGYGRLHQGPIPCGAILGTAELVRVSRTLNLAPEISPLERTLGDYSPGRWGFVFRNPVELAEPIPFKGLLGFWQVPEQIARLLMETTR